MAFSLANAYDVHLLLPRAEAGIHAQIQSIRLPFYKKLWLRLCFTHPIALWHCWRIKTKTVHIHDPELIPLAFILKYLGRTIVYDVHENVRKQLAFKLSNNSLIFKNLYLFFDQKARKHFHLILAEKSYQFEYQNVKKPYTLILNYPSLAFFETYRLTKSTEIRKELFYIGQISLARGIDTLIRALALLKVQGLEVPVQLFGDFEFDLASVKELQQVEGFQSVKHLLNFHGKTNPAKAFVYAVNAFAGIALLKPVGDFPESYPTKIFEYMAMGLPVITSDFLLYRPIVETHQCGFCINSFDYQALAEKIQWLFENQQNAQQMGANGRMAVEKYYNWQSEEQKLLSFYQTLLRQSN